MTNQAQKSFSLKTIDHGPKTVEIQKLVDLVKLLKRNMALIRFMQK